jgi:hypothetical protein
MMKLPIPWPSVAFYLVLIVGRRDSLGGRLGREARP